MKRTVEIINSSLRDGIQSLWSGRATPEEMLPIARTIDLGGYHSVDFMAAVQFEVSVRYLKENPWERIRAIRRVIHRLPMICHLRSRCLTSFDLVPDAVFNLMVERLAANGLRRAMVFDPLHDIENMRFATRAAQACGMDVSAVLFFTISPFHTDEYYARKAREVAALEPEAICIRDPSGLLTPERVHRLVPVVRKNIGQIPLELKSHCSTGLAEDCYVNAAELGVDRLFAAADPIANGPSVPSIGALLPRLRAAGLALRVDESRVEDEADYFRELAASTGRPTGRRVEAKDSGQYEHQMPGNMLQFTRDQLSGMKLEHKLGEVLEEFPRVREDMGFPVMVTPVSQLVCVQAVLNVVYGERYKLIPNEVRNYVRGHYGKPEAPLAPELLDRVGHGPGPRFDGGDETLDRVRREFGPFESDDDLILHVLFRPDQLDGVMKMHRRKEDSDSNGVANKLIRLVTQMTSFTGVREIEVRTPDIAYRARM
jgi:oxaloacetate decarboxylase alpha subunit